jgi:hypothetical protein|tara:strand:+ start:220 stop:564 length:345 start_codon:yes stop_codon:yes gene_type:complete
MDLWNKFTSLCPPAQLYFLISIISVLTIFKQNYKNPYQYCIGIFKTDTSCNNLVFFLIKFIYIFIWTYILQLLCRSGYKTISWLLVLLPFIGMFILMGLLLFSLIKMNNKKLEE